MIWWRSKKSEADPERPATDGASALETPPQPLVRFKEAGATLARLAEHQPLARRLQVVDIRLPSVIRRHSVTGPVCHVGSKVHKGDEDAVRRFRGIFGASCEFVGLDIEPGHNVDVVADICDPALFSKHPELSGRFRFAFVSALLEHVEDPFAAARNVTQLLEEGGILYSVHPWVWGYHPYPDDYWRFSIRGIRKLFPGIEWIEWWYAGNNPEVGLRIPEGEPTNERKFFLSQSVSGALAGILSDRSLPYLNTGAVGRRVLRP